MACLSRNPARRSAYCLGAFAAFAVSLSFSIAAHSDVSVPYRVEIRGVENDKLRAALRSASDLIALREKPPATMNLLQRRIDKDVARLTEVLLSQGYYDAKVASRSDETVKPVQVILDVSLGEIYKLARVEVRDASEKSAGVLDWPEFAELPAKAGQPVKAQQVLDGEKRLVRILKKRGYPRPEVTKRTVEIDRAAHSAQVTYRVVPGPQGRFGPTKVGGLESIEESFVRDRIPWKEGDVFNGDLINKLEESLRKSSLFSLVKVVTAKELNPDGTISTDITLSERKHRTVSAGVTYKTDEGPGARVGWENRNLFGRAEKLELGAGISDIGSDLEGAYTKPDFLRPDQSLVLRSRFAADRPDAFTSISEKLSASVERKLTDHTKAGLGVALKLSQVDQLHTTEHYGLVSLPLYLRHENSNDPIEPIRGQRLHLELAPMTDILNGHATFLKSQADYSRYFDIIEKPLCVIAGRLSVGSILGAARYDIPADERFYAGGSNSIRGYNYQSVGPLDGDNPVGGKSMLTLSCEFRMRVRDKIDLIAFLDAGNAYKTEMPGVGDLKFGSGLGVSYYSGIGPIRLDVGIPLEPRAGIDDAFQVYVNLGHSF